MTQISNKKPANLAFASMEHYISILYTLKQNFKMFYVSMYAFEMHKIIQVDM